MTKAGEAGRASLRARPKGERLTPTIRAAITAQVLAGGQTPTAIARQFGVHHQTVTHVAAMIQGLDPARVAEIRRGLPAVLTVLAGAHAVQALKTAASDPGSSVKSTFGAKLAVEAGRGAEPGAAAPGAAMLTFIGQLNVTPSAPAAPVLETTAERVPDPMPAAKGWTRLEVPVLDLDETAAPASPEGEA